MRNDRSSISLPPGQRPGSKFPRFGAATRPLTKISEEISLRVTGVVTEPGVISQDDLRSLPRHEQVSDLHCVTTWTKQNLHWAGWRLADLYHQVIVPRFAPPPEARYLVLFAADGYCCSLLLEDALGDDVLVADTLDGEPLSPLHGAPLRVVSPQQYAYKSLKHLSGIALREQPVVLPAGLEHPRGRVERQERHARLPAWLVRLPYRMMIGTTAYLLRRGIRSTHFVGRPTLLDELMPEPEHFELHDIWVAAPPAETYRSLLQISGREIRLLGPLMALRKLPALLTGKAIRGDSNTPVIAALVQAGFIQLAEQTDREIVFGVVGRFWKLTQNAPLRTVRNRDDFTAFAKPGYAKAATSFLVRAEGSGSRVITETRIRTTDPASARSFRRYWRVVRPGSGLIRRSWLAALRRRLTD